MATEAETEYVSLAELYKEPIPDELVKEAINVDVEEKWVEITIRNSTWEVFYRKATPPANVQTNEKTVRKERGLETYKSEQLKPPVVLLHGKNFTSWTWEDNDVMPILAARGHTVLALDLPKCGETKGDDAVPPHLKGEFLARFIHRTLTNTSLPVVVCPTGAHQYVLPYLLNMGADANKRVGAAVLVSPNWPKTLDASKIKPTRIPVLILYDNSSNNPSWRDAEPKLQRGFVNGDYLEVKGGRNMEFPAHWHARTTLFNFMKNMDYKLEQ